MTTLPPLLRSTFVHLTIHESALPGFDITKLGSWRSIKDEAKAHIAQRMEIDKVRLVKFRIMRPTEHDLPGTAYTVYVRAEEIL